jgi:hypothetical protein
MFEMVGKGTNIFWQTVPRLENYLFDVGTSFIRAQLKFWVKNAIERRIP